MSERTEGYAQAIAALAETEGALDAVETELLDIARAVDEHNELRQALTDPNLPIANRLSFVETKALTAAHPTTRAALAMVITAGRVDDLLAIAQEVARRAAQARDRELAEVYVAKPLSKGQEDKLRKALEEATGKQLQMKVFVDESVLGGVRAKIGDTVIDGSVASRLDEIRSRVGSR